MAQITWQNIAMPNFGSDRESSRFDHSGSPITPVFDSLTQILKDRVALDEKNRANAIQNNDLNLAAQAAKIRDYATMAQGEKDGSLNPLSLVPEMGRMFTPGKLTEALEGRKKTLESQAVNEALPGAQAAGEKGLSNTSAIAILRSQLTEKGLPAELINKHLSQYAQNHAADEAVFNKQKEDNTRDLLTKFGIPKTHAEIAAFRDQADATGIIYNRDMFSKQLGEEISGNRADQQNQWAIEAHDRTKVTNAQHDLTFNRNDATWKREESERLLGNTTFAKAQEVMKTTGDKSAGLRVVADSGLPPEIQNRMSLSLRQGYDALSALDDGQTAAIDDYILRATGKTAAEVKRQQKEIDTAKVNYENATGFGDRLDKYLDVLQKDGKGFIEAIGANAMQIGLTEQFLTTFKAGGKEAVNILNNKLLEIQNIPGFENNEEVSKRILLLALQDTYPSNLTTLNSVGVDSAKLTENVNKRVKKFLANQDVAAQIKQANDALAENQTEALRNISHTKTAMIQDAKQSNITGVDSNGLWTKKAEQRIADDAAAKKAKHDAKVKEKTDPKIKSTLEMISKQPAFNPKDPGDSMTKTTAIEALQAGSSLTDAAKANLATLDKERLNALLREQINPTEAVKDSITAPSADVISRTKNAVMKNGVIWATVDGATRRIDIPVQEPQIRNGEGKIVPNPYYPEYVKKLEQLGIKK